jgi:DNA-directed RNA polymerase specialized sigma24 family protein
VTAQPSAGELRELIPAVLGVLVRRGADFATAEDAVQEALVAALGLSDPPEPPRRLRTWPNAIT